MDYEPMTPNWLGHSPREHIVTTIGLHGQNQFWRQFPDTSNQTAGQPDIDIGSISNGLLTTGRVAEEGVAVYVGGRGRLSKFLIFDATHVWDADEGGGAGQCTGRWRQHVRVGPAAPAQRCGAALGLAGCVVSVGFCDGAEEYDTFFIDFHDAGNFSSGGALRHSIRAPVGWWPRSPGGQGHRSAVAVADNATLFVAAQSESPEYGWLARFDLTTDGESVGGWPQFGNSTWNVTLSWEHATVVPALMHTEVAPLPNGSSFLAVLANGELQVRDPASGMLQGSWFLDQGVGAFTASNGWSLRAVPPECTARANLPADAAGLVVAYNRAARAPVQKVFVALLAVRGDSDGRLALTHAGLTEVATEKDMALRELAVGPMEPQGLGGGAPPEQCAGGLGAFVAAYSSCGMPNPCPQISAAKAVVVGFNLSAVNRCASCRQGYGGPQCGLKCACFSSSTNPGYCYDGPSDPRGGSCRCKSETYTANCLPCLCKGNRGLCDEGEHGSGQCASCLQSDWWGPECLGICQCKKGWTCNAGPHGDGQCFRPHPPAPSSPPPGGSGGGSSPDWQLVVVYAVAAGVGTTTIGALTYYMWQRGRADYVRPPRHVQSGDGGSEDAPAEGAAAGDARVCRVVGASTTDSFGGDDWKERIAAVAPLSPGVHIPRVPL